MPFWSRSPAPADPYRTDPALVRAAQRGDRRAFGALFDQYAPMVHGILLARVRPAEADDLVQEVFLTALERIASLQSPDAFGGWLAAIARNKGTDARKQQRPSGPLPEVGRADPDHSDTERILRALQGMPETYRETLILRLIEDMSGPEIAARTGLTPESVRVNLHRGMMKLRDALGVVIPKEGA